MKNTTGLRFDPARRDRLRSEARRRRLPPFKTLRRLGLEKGETFVDIDRLRSLAGEAGFRLIASLDVNDEEYAVVLKETVPQGKNARISRMPDAAHRRKS
ncbi:MAG: hypothetical protein FJY83_02585 [Candidatus Aminicenantes bacterium]|nr:hypothetical protein [Candidatus Aminicenantes bacterium]